MHRRSQARITCRLTRRLTASPLAPATRPQPARTSSSPAATASGATVSRSHSSCARHHRTGAAIRCRRRVGVTGMGGHGTAATTARTASALRSCSRCGSSIGQRRIPAGEVNGVPYSRGCSRTSPHPCPQVTLPAVCRARLRRARNPGHPDARGSRFIRSAAEADGAAETVCETAHKAFPRKRQRAYNGADGHGWRLSAA